MVDEVPKFPWSIESVRNVNANRGFMTVSKRFSINLKFLRSEDKTVGLNADGVNVNMGQCRGLGKLIKDGVSRLELVHCFSHRFELALKDAFDISPFG